MKHLFLVVSLLLPLSSLAEETCATLSSSFKAGEKCMRDCVDKARNQQVEEMKNCGSDRDGEESTEDVANCQREAEAKFEAAKAKCRKI